MRWNDRTSVVVPGCIFLYVGLGAVRADDDLCLSEDRRDYYYGQTLSTKNRPDKAIDFKLIEGVPIIAKVKTASEETQGLTSILLNAYMKVANGVAMAFLQETARLRATDTRFQALTEAEVALAFSNFEPVRPSGADEHARDESHFGGLKSLVPTIEELGRAAGYSDIRRDATPGIAMCLYLGELRKTRAPADALLEVLSERNVIADVQIDQPMEWREVRTALTGDIPLLVRNSTGKVFLAIGYLQASDGSQLMFGFQPHGVERGVHYAGRQMMESRLDAFKKSNPLRQDIQPTYFDVESTHKEHQFSGFCAMKYSQELRFSYAADPEVNQPGIESMVRHRLEKAAARKKQGE
jgi:hypothetical protein